MKTVNILPPKSTNELLSRAKKLEHTTIGELATSLGVDVPYNLSRHKGWVGELLEVYLGANAANLPLPDFMHLNVELKTLPVYQNIPKESTYICTAPMQDNLQTWHESACFKKLQHILFVPIVTATPNQPLSNKKIGKAFFFKPNIEQMKLLEQDWNELMEFFYLGQLDKLTAKYGNIIHVRPKAANCKQLGNSYNEYGDTVKTVARGFYLRSSFTKQLLLDSLS